MQKNIKLFPFYKLFSYDNLFYYAVSILYLTGAKGFSLSQVALLSSIYSLVAIISQIPASIIADRIGLRNSMLFGNILCMLWGIFYIIFPAFPMFIIAELFSGFGFALKGVSESPFLYSSLKKMGEISKFAKIESKGSTYYFTIEAIASVVAGYLYFINPYLPLIFATTCWLAATIIAFYMEPIKTNPKDKQTITERFNDMTHGFKFIFKSKRLQALLLFTCTFYGILALANLYIKTYLNDIQVSSTAFGYIFAIASVAAAIGAAVQGKIEKRHRNKTLTTVSLIFISSYLVIGLSYLLFKNYKVLLIVGVIVYLVQSFIKGAYRIIIKEYVSRYTTSAIRSKLMSIYYLSENLGSTILLFVASKTIDSLSIGTSYCIFGFILFVILILILNHMSTRVGLSPDKYTKSDRLDLEENN